MAAPARPMSSPPGQQQPPLNHGAAAAASSRLVSHPSASASPPPSADAAASAAAATAMDSVPDVAAAVALFRGASGEASHVHQTMSLLLRNEFSACKALAAAHGERDLKCQLVLTYMRVIEAASTYGEAELQAALKIAWAVEKKASGMKNSIEGRLLQADTHFLGAIVQIIQQSFVKVALNLRRSWIYYEQAAKMLLTYQGDDADELRGWSDYGNGAYQLVFSLLPPTVMKIAGWAGYSGDREVGLSLLRRSQQSSSFMAPLSCLLLLTYLVNISSLTGESDELVLPQCDPLLAWADARFPQGVLFLLTRSRLARCKRNLEEAITLAKRAIHNCRELPSVAALIHFHTGWCSFFLLDWQQSAHYFDCMIHATPGGGYTPLAGQPKILPAEQRLIDAEEAEARAEDGNGKQVLVRMPPARSSALTFYACLCGVNYMLLGAPHKARYYFGLVQSLCDPSSKKPLDVYARRKSADMLARRQGDPVEDALLDAGELLLTWNGAHQMPAAACRRMIALLDEAAAKQLPHWTATHRASVILYKADMLKGLNDLPAALEQVQLLQPYLPELRTSAKSRADGTLAFAHYTAAFLYIAVGRLQEGQEHLKAAQGVSGYDQFNMVQVRLHALEHRLKREKAQRLLAGSGGGPASAAAAAAK